MSEFRFRPNGITMTAETTADASLDANGRLMVASVSTNTDGSTNTALPPGRAAAANSVPVVLSTEDKASLDLIGTPNTPVATAAVAGFQVAKVAPGTLYGLNVVAGASAGYVMLFDAVAAPADGAVAPKKCYAIAANASLDRSWDRGLVFTAGITVVFSTTGPYTKTVSATAFIETEVK